MEPRMSDKQMRLMDHLASSRHLHLLLFVTEQCNFRCTYCYEDFLLGRMPEPVIQGIEALIRARAPSLSSLHLSFFGGEPLVAKDILARLSRAGREAAIESGIAKFISAVTTNAWFLDARTAEELYNVGVTSYQVTLDGIGDVHDETRVRKGGGRTFDRIWGNLLDISRTTLPIRVFLRLHVAPKKMPVMERLAAQIRDEFDTRFIVSPHTISPMGGPNDDAVDMFRSFREGMAAVEHIRKIGARPIAGDIPGPPPAEPLPEVCYAAQANSFVIRANGVVAKCTVALRDGRNALGRILPDGQLEIDMQKMGLWIRGLSTLDEKVMGCPLHNLPLPGAGPGLAAE